MKLNYIKFTLMFIRNLILNNKVKLLFLKVSTVLFYFAGTIPDSIVINKIVKEIQVDDKTYLYVKSYIRNNELGYDIIQSDKPQKVTNGVLLTSEYHDGNIAMWVLFSIITFIIVLLTFINRDEESGWEINYCLEEAFLSLVECEFEYDKYYYICCGKLLGVRDHKVTHHYILGEFRVRGFDELKTCPKFETKTQRRENKLKRIGIN